MVRRNKPTVMGKLLNFFTGTTKAHKRRDIEEEKLRHAGKTADFLSRKDVENQRVRHTRPNPEKQAAQNEALRKLNGHPEPARRQPPPVRTDKPLPVERTRPEPAHTRRQRVRTDGRDDPRHRRDRSDRRQQDPRSRPQPEPQRRQEARVVPEFIAPTFGSSVHSSHMQSLDSRGGEPHGIKGPNRKPEIIHKVPDTAKPVHVADVLSRAPTRRKNVPARDSDRTTQFGDFLRPVSPLLPPTIPTLPSLPNAARSQQGRQAPGRDKSIPFCQMCETRPSSLDGCYSVLGYHLCTECRRSAFSEDAPQELLSPVSPLTPDQTPEARLQDFDFANTNTAKRGPVTRASSRSKSNTTRGSDTRNLTGNASTLQRAPSSGLHPALHKRASRRQPTYSTIFNERSQAQPAPALPRRARAEENPLPPLPLRHKTSSVYSLTEALPPRCCPRAISPPSPLPHRHRQHSNSPSWTEDWSGYGASTVAEAQAVRVPVPPMPVVPEWNGDEEGDGVKRDTKFYGHWDEIVGYKSTGPGGRRRYNGL
ncbi:sterol-4-alpha-carboxylate 3-dehydrogenase, decarboxylating [Physcia stellaris]|nr:sterol-4-alpha-carboxylate 3-dehydrogenase, decarboxylating [Physcia stellaris]